MGILGMDFTSISFPLKFHRWISPLSHSPQNFMDGFLHYPIPRTPLHPCVQKSGTWDPGVVLPHVQILPQDHQYQLDEGKGNPGLGD